MKLRAIDQREPVTVRISLAPDVHDKLTAYIIYAEQTGRHYDLKQLINEICRAFVDGGDKGFSTWWREQGSEEKGGKYQPKTAPLPTGKSASVLQNGQGVEAKSSV